jgi:hypothetical protein
MKRSARRDERGLDRTSGPSVPPGPPRLEGTATTDTPASHPAYLLALLVAAVCIGVSVSFRLVDPDLWQHLAVGRAMWSEHAIPRVNLWTWPTYGAPQVLPSWGFRALLWPCWALAGMPGLFAWRWIATLAALGLAWSTARGMGARGFATLAVLVVCGLIYRQRSQVRPEMLAGILIALEIGLLEAGRRDGRAWILPLVAIAWGWANLHLTYYLGLLVLGVYALDAARARRAEARGLGLTLLAAIAISFVNPFGARALWEPFDFALFHRNEPIFRSIGELRPLNWRFQATNGLLLLLPLWPLLALWRARRHGLDLAEGALLVVFSALAIAAQRMVGFYALVAAPFVARDLGEWLNARSRSAAPAPPWLRAAACMTACVALPLAEWRRPEYPLGLHYDWRAVPVAACDFMAGHDVSGRGFNPFHYGGYLLWRFWPDRARLPFMDIHQTGTREDRDLVNAALLSHPTYLALMRKYDFDYALLDRRLGPQQRLLDWFDDDRSWSVVFMDDVAALYVRRSERHRALLERTAYRVWPAGPAGLEAVARRLSADPALRVVAAAELRRQIAESPYHETAARFLAQLERPGP